MDESLKLFRQIHHLGFTVADVDEPEAEAEQASLTHLIRGRRPDGSGFTYFDTADQAGFVL